MPEVEYYCAACGDFRPVTIDETGPVRDICCRMCALVIATIRGLMADE